MNNMKLTSGEDIKFDNLFIHQPSIKEVCSLEDEGIFLIGTQLLTFNQKILQGQDKINQNNINEFDILMSVMLDPRGVKQKEMVEKVLHILFPSYQIQFSEQGILLMREGSMGSVNRINFPQFRELIQYIFCLDQITGTPIGGYNPSGPTARRIMEKLEERKKKLAEQNNKKGKSSQNRENLFHNYCSVMVVSMRRTWKEILDFTVCQFFDTYKRTQMEDDYNTYVDMRMLGAKNLEEVPHWKVPFDKADEIKKNGNKQ